VSAALVAYFVPAADLSLANTPVAGDLLREAGLVGAPERVTFIGAVSTSSGYRLELVAAYADSSRTVLLMRSSPASVAADQVLQITDQFGRSYQLQYGYTNTETGDMIFQFEPLNWPDPTTGARITLHISNLGSAGDPQTRIQGSWTLSAVLRVDQPTHLPLPGAGTLGPAQFQFTSVTYTPASIVVDIDISGVNMSDVHAVLPDGGKGTPILGIELFDPKGQTVGGSYDLYGPGTLTRNATGVHVHFIGYRTGPGAYRLHVRYGHDEFDRTLTIP
ncbi:MAG TPA: hypothetical protein VHO95_10675, partial [Candidatus Dormibacteraeota bacterium]|nr:hypothetical protein [Candidatus Dormibacteraeota bacterium]